MKPNIIVLISGDGSNLQAIIDAINAGKLNANIAAVISNKPDAYGLERAKNANIKTYIIKKDDAFERKLAETIQIYDPKLIVLAGFMAILSPDFVSKFENKMINIHPSLLPKHPGLQTHRRVLECGEKEHGCTIHIVTKEVDRGPILAQAKLEVLADDTPETLESRVKALEHRLYPETIQKYLSESSPISPSVHV